MMKIGHFLERLPARNWFPTALPDISESGLAMGFLQSIFLPCTFEKTDLRTVMCPNSGPFGEE